MAGIEKICELSGDYPGYLMYGYKRNHIQVCPEYRKRFKGAKATLTIVSAEVMTLKTYNNGRLQSFGYPCKWTVREEFNGNARRYLADILYYDDAKLSIEYTYILQVEGVELQGQVKGKYLNYSRNLSAVKRRMKRLIGPGLVIKSDVGSRKEIINNFIRELENFSKETEDGQTVS